MKLELILAAVVAISTSSVTAHASEGIVIPLSAAHDVVDFEDLKEVHITEGAEVPAWGPYTYGETQGQQLPPYGAGWSGFASQALGAIIGAGQGLVTFGQKVFDLIQNNRGVSTLEYGHPITVIPQTHSSDPAAAFNSMESWQDPRMKTFNVEFRNWRNAVAVSFSYIVSYQYGGRYEGKGAYLQGVAVSAGNNTVGPLWRLDAAAQYVGSTNSGTLANPIAGVRLIVNYTVQRKALAREYKGSHVIFVRGDGRLTKLEDSQDPAGPEASLR